MDISKAFFYRPGALIRASGPDASTFLQGQFSNDLKREEERPSVYGLWLNRKGKIVADSFVLKVDEDDYWLASYYGEESTVVERLDSCLVMDEVELEAKSAECEGAVLWGGAIVLALEALELQVPEQGCWVGSSGVFVFWGRRGKEDALEILFVGAEGEAELQKLREALDKTEWAERTAGEMEALSVAAGIPRVGIDVGESDLPQEVALDGCAVSYNKGCYLGQEVMARIKAMGTVRKRLSLVRLDGEMPSGESPWSVLDGEGKRRGSLRVVAQVGEALLGLALLPAGNGVDSYRIQNEETKVIPIKEG